MRILWKLFCFFAVASLAGKVGRFFVERLVTIWWPDNDEEKSTERTSESGEAKSRNNDRQKQTT